ncbi:MAG TPA: DUF2834 domain-containing protein [Pseudomonadales bacterium]|nr:DUF2834 domain-containing protein [Pseudomonadales bacterium]
MSRATVYLLLAILGALVPWLFFLDFLRANGLGPSFVAALFANGAAGGFTADLLISSVVFWIWMGADIRERGRGSPWLFVALNLTIGLSCALPAYLHGRERASGA